MAGMLTTCGHDNLGRAISRSLLPEYISKNLSRQPGKDTFPSFLIYCLFQESRDRLKVDTIVVQEASSGRLQSILRCRLNHVSRTQAAPTGALRLMKCCLIFYKQDVPTGLLRFPMVDGRSTCSMTSQTYPCLIGGWEPANCGGAVILDFPLPFHSSLCILRSNPPSMLLLFLEIACSVTCSEPRVLIR